jgi:hypothetical protein
MNRGLGVFFLLIAACVVHVGIARGGEIADGRARLRGKDAGFVAGVTAVDAAGVHTTAGDGTVRIIAWHMVVEVDGSHAEEADGFLAMGDELWRALSRLDRGDLPAAEVMLEGLTRDLARDLAMTPGPTAEAIWQGLLRCRLDRGAQTGAAAAWLSWRNARTTSEPAERASTEFSDRTPTASGLVPAIPPVWVNVPSVAVLASSGVEQWKLDTAGTESSIGLLAQWYLRAARGAAEREGGAWPEVSSDQDVVLVAAMVKAQYGDDKERHAAREELRGIMGARAEGWVEAWGRVAIGRSLLKENDVETQRLGIVELLHIPSRLEAVVPYLTGVALADSAAGLRKLGDIAGATVLRDELLRRYAGHPAVEWSQVRDWPMAVPTRKAEPEAEELPET